MKAWRRKDNLKKYSSLIISVVIGIVLFFICFDHAETSYPNEYYNVYLDGELLGTILSKTELEQYINDKTEHIINAETVVKTYCPISEEAKKLIQDGGEPTYYKNDKKEDCVDITLTEGETIETVYTPTGLQIEKILTFTGNVSNVEDIYSKIVNIKSFTVRGYQFIIKDGDETSYVYVTDKDIFEQAVNEFIRTYVGKDNYKAYLDGSQLKIETTGNVIENIYIEEEISVKEKQIPIDAKIYTDAMDLAQFLLYGDNPNTFLYTVLENEMIEDIAMKNKISIQEFLISNPRYKDENSLISEGTNVQIKETNPQLKAVVEEYVVKDQVNEYKTIYQYDSNKYVGYEEVLQKGDNGLERIRQRVKTINGIIVYVEPKGKETLKPSIDKIVLKGDKIIPNVGDVNNWAWPTNSGWTVGDGYGWRTHPIYGHRQRHPALDISGTGYNSPIYAANNGTVMKIVLSRATSGYGTYMIINHNNGYYTLYAHMNKIYEGIEEGTTVMRGQQIGYMGCTGSCTGPHVHYEVWKNCQNCDINPWSLYR